MKASLNLPVWNPKDPTTRGAFNETWYLKLNDPTKQRALWIRFTLLVSRNGFRKVSEATGIYFQKQSNGEVSKTVVKQSFGIEAFSQAAEAGVRISSSEMTGTHSHGLIQSKGKSIEWNLQFRPRQDVDFTLVAPSLKRFKLVRKTAFTVGEDLLFSGTTRINGESVEWNNAVGMQAHWSGTELGHSWVWGHCNHFLDEQGVPVPFVFEGCSFKTRVLGIVSPPICSFFFQYKGEAYRFNTVWDAIRSRSKNSITEWSFRVDHGDLSFRGVARANHKDFAGLTLEDTQGSFLYCSNSKVSDLKIHVYRNGKLEASYHSEGAAAFEIVSREKNPYVPLLV